MSVLAFRPMMLTSVGTYYLTFWASAAEGTTTRVAKVVEIPMPLVRVHDEAGAKEVEG